MNSQRQELFGNVFAPHDRREFIKRAAALGLSGTALTAFLEACGSSTRLRGHLGRLLRQICPGYLQGRGGVLLRTGS